MNTKTMRLPPRRVLTAIKRKEPDGVNNSAKPSITTGTAPPTAKTIPTNLPKPTAAEKSALPSPKRAKSNQLLLAGYLAHEFLSKGTLFGEHFDPAEIAVKKEKVVIGSQKAEPEPSGGGMIEQMKDKCERYAEVSDLLKREGAHIQGIVNPTQLGRLLQM